MDLGHAHDGRRHRRRRRPPPPPPYEAGRESEKTPRRSTAEPDGRPPSQSVIILGLADMPELALSSRPRRWMFYLPVGRGQLDPSHGAHPLAPLCMPATQQRARATGCRRRRRRRRPSGAARRFAPPRVRAAAEAASAASFDGEAEATQTARHVTRRQPAPPLRMTAPSPPIRVSISQASAFFYFAAAARRAVHARRAIYGRCLRHALFRPALLCCAALLRSRGDGSAVLSSPRAGPAIHPGCALWRWQAAALPDAMSLRRAWRKGGPAGGGGGSSSPSGSVLGYQALQVRRARL